MSDSTPTRDIDLEVVKRVELSVPPERVWDALTRPEELVLWFPDREARIEPRSGAEGAWVWNRHGAYAVKIDVFEPPARLVWTWARDADVPLSDTVCTTVEWRLEADGRGGTILHLREHGFVRERDREENDGGWDHELGELVSYLGGARA